MAISLGMALFEKGPGNLPLGVICEIIVVDVMDGFFSEDK